MSVTVLSRLEATAKLSTNPSGATVPYEAFQKAYAADWLRSALAIRGPLSALALLNCLRNVCNPVFGTFENDDLRIDKARVADRMYQTFLNASHRLDDIAQHQATSPPQYMQAPLRLIYLGPGATVAAVIGGSSNRRSEELLGAEIFTYGFARYVMKASLTGAKRRDDTCWQNPHDWLGCQVRSLREFTSMLMGQGSDNWAAGSPQGAIDVEVFSPELATSRWLRLKSLREKPSGIRLCRATLNAPEYRYGNKLRFIATLARREGSIIVGRSSVLTVNDGDRLVFGLESRHSSSIKVNATISNAELIMSLHRRLPAPERKLTDLSVRGTAQDRDLLRFPAALLPLVQSVLQLLDVSLSVTGDDRE